MVSLNAVILDTACSKIFPQVGKCPTRGKGQWLTRLYRLTDCHSNFSPSNLSANVVRAEAAEGPSSLDHTVVHMYGYRYIRYVLIHICVYYTALQLHIWYLVCDYLLIHACNYHTHLWTLIRPDDAMALHGIHHGWLGDDGKVWALQKNCPWWSSPCLGHATHQQHFVHQVLFS